MKRKDGEKVGRGFEKKDGDEDLVERIMRKNGVDDEVLKRIWGYIVEIMRNEERVVGIVWRKGRKKKDIEREKNVNEWNIDKFWKKIEKKFLEMRVFIEELK